MKVRLFQFRHPNCSPEEYYLLR